MTATVRQHGGDCLFHVVDKAVAVQDVNDSGRGVN